MMQSHLDQRTTSWVGALLILTTIAVTCVSVVASDYGYADDFWILGIRPLNAENITKAFHGFLGEGRCLYSIWTLGVMGQIDGIEGLKYVRLLTLFGIFFSSVVFYKLLHRHLIEDRIDASLMACIFSINPSFLVMAGWAEIGCDSYACMLGLLACYFFLRNPYFNAPTRKLGEDAPSGNASSWGRVVVSALLLFLAMCLYQPGAMLYWTGVGIWIIGRFTGQREDWIKLLKMLGLFICVLGVYFVFAHAFAGPDSRFHVSMSIVRRLGWFVLYPLRSSLSYPFYDPSTFYSVAMLLILSYGLWSYCRQTSRTMWIPPLVLSLTPLTVLPTIFAAGHYDVSRTRAALYGLIIILWCLTFTVIVRYLKDSFTLRNILIPTLVILSVMGQFELQRFFIIPQIRDESALLVKLQEYVRENPKLDRPIVIWAPTTFPPITELHGVDEMGFASLSRHGPPYEEQLMLAGVANRKYEDLPDVKFVTIYSDGDAGQQKEAPPPDAFEINLKQLRAPR